MSGGVPTAARALAEELLMQTPHTSQWWRNKIDALIIAMGGKPASHDRNIELATLQLHYVALLAETAPSVKQARLLKAAAKTITQIVMVAI